MRVTHIYNQANDIKYLEHLVDRLDLEPEQRIQELTLILSQLK